MPKSSKSAKSEVIKPRVYDYCSTTSFLADMYLYRKSLNHCFSHRFICLQLGLKSHGFFNLLLKGKRRIPPRLVEPLAKILGLSEEESRYFSVLASWEYNRNNNERKRLETEMKTISAVTFKVFKESQKAFMDRWYYQVVRAMTTVMSINGNFKEVGDRIRPRLSETEVRQSIMTHQECGLIRFDEKANRFVLTHKNLTTGKRLFDRRAVKEMNRAFMKMSLDAYDQLPREQRQLSTVTVAVNKEGFEALTTLLQEARRNAVKIGSGSRKPDRVYLVNMQIFPVSQLPDEPPHGDATKHGRVKNK